MLVLLLTLLAGTMLPPVPAEGADLDVCFAETYTVGLYEEHPVPVEGEAGALSARLFVPRGTGPYPGVLILPGGGRHDDVNYPPRFLAARLARCGIASVIYDKRGTGTSEGRWAEATYEDLLSDAEAAWAALTAHPAIDPGRTGVIGFSQGGRLATILAARTQAPSFVVAVSSPFVPLAETRLYALRRAFERLDYSARTQQSLLGLWKAYLEGLAHGRPLEEVEAEAAEWTYLPEQLRPLRTNPSTQGPLFNSLAQDFDADLQRLRTPVFAIFGGDDPIVPVEASIGHLRGLVGQEADHLITAQVVPDVDHSFLYAGALRQRYPFEVDVLRWLIGRMGVGSCERTASLSDASRPDGCAVAPTASPE